MSTTCALAGSCGKTRASPSQPTSQRASPGWRSRRRGWRTRPSTRSTWSRMESSPTWPPSVSSSKVGVGGVLLDTSAWQWQVTSVGHLWCLRWRCWQCAVWYADQAGDWSRLPSLSSLSVSASDSLFDALTWQVIGLGTLQWLCQRSVSSHASGALFDVVTWWQLVWTALIVFIEGQCQCQWSTAWCSDLMCDCFGHPLLSSSRVNVSATAWHIDLRCDWFGHPSAASSKVSVCPCRWSTAWCVDSTWGWCGPLLLSSLKVSVSASNVMHCLMYWADVWLLQLYTAWCIDSTHGWSGPLLLSFSKVSVTVSANDEVFDVVTWHVIGLGHLQWLHQSRFLCQWCTVWCIKLPHDWSGPPSLSSSKVSVSATVWCSDLTCDWFGPPTVTSSKVSASTSGTLMFWHKECVIGLGHLHYLHQRSVSVSVPLFDVVTWHVTGLGHLQWLHQRSVPVVHWCFSMRYIWLVWVTFIVFIKG